MVVWRIVLNLEILIQWNFILQDSSDSSSSSLNEGENTKKQSKKNEKSSAKNSAHKSTVKRCHSPSLRNSPGDHNSPKKGRHYSENDARVKQIFSGGEDPSPSSHRKSVDNQKNTCKKPNEASDKRHVRTGWSSSPEPPDPGPRKRSASPEFRRKMSRNPCQSTRRWIFIRVRVSYWCDFSCEKKRRKKKFSLGRKVLGS